MSKLRHGFMTTARKTLWITTLALMVLSMMTCLASSFSSDPLPAPPAMTAALPQASPPPAMAIFQLPTGVIHRSAASAYRGGSMFDERTFVATAVLVTHPRGDVLIDTGFGRRIEEQFGRMPALFRALTHFEHHRSAADILEGAGYDRRRLRGILLTHAHWDHVSGVVDFPGTPVLVTREERAFIGSDIESAKPARALQGVRYEEYGFERGPYLGFSRSHDLHGDGSVVIVPAPGHTPGSVIVFVNLPSARRYAFIGDIVWQREGFTKREERPWPVRLMLSEERLQVREALMRVAALSARYPEITIVPAHDARGFADIPTMQ